MSKSEPIEGEAKLRLLRETNPARYWNSLDMTLRCVLCEQQFSVREIRIRSNYRGQTWLRCPTAGCHSASDQWIHPGNPLISEEAWKDWERLLAKVPV